MRAILLCRYPGEEMHGLLRAAGGELAGEIRQSGDPDPDYWVSQSSLQSLPPGNTLVADGELSARQARKLHRATGLQVMDRTSLVLRIFALHARSRSASLQVEAAELEHTSGQLRNRWPHLARPGGGVGTRGPGETQLEADRREIARRLYRIRKEIRAQDSQRLVQRRERLRGSTMRVSLFGYTNSGKSTIAEMLGAEGTRPSPEMFSTLDPHTRRIRLRTHSILLTDTVGIIRDMPRPLVRAFRSTLQEGAESDLLLHVLSGSNWQEEQQEGLALLEELGIDAPILTVISRPQEHVPGAVTVGDTADELRKALESDYRQRAERVELLFPYSTHSPLSELYENAEVVWREDRADGVLVAARVLPEGAYRWEPFQIRSSR